MPFSQGREFPGLYGYSSPSQPSVAAGDIAAVEFDTDFRRVPAGPQPVIAMAQIIGAPTAGAVLSTTIQDGGAVGQFIVWVSNSGTAASGGYAVQLLLLDNFYQ